MDSENTGKSQVRLSIYNQNFSLLVAGDPAEIEQAAQEVDELMTTIARSGNMDSTRVAVLACLHLQDRVRTLEREFAEMKSRVDDRTRRLSTLLDSVIESGS
jgi:cell division protein ZapA